MFEIYLIRHKGGDEMMNNRQASEDVRNFLYNIKWLRKNKNLSKRSMAKILKISAETLNRIENGELPPKLSADVIWRIYLNFGISPDMQFREKLDSIDK